MPERPLVYVPIYTDITGHRKMRRIRRAIGGQSAVPVHLHIQEMLRAVGAEYPTGVLPDDFEPEDFAELACWTGDPLEWKTALFDCGWLRVDDQGQTVVSGWDKYAGRAIRRREQDRERKRAWRESKNVRADSVRTPADSSGLQRTSARVRTRPHKEKEKEKEKDLSLGMTLNEIEAACYQQCGALVGSSISTWRRRQPVDPDELREALSEPRATNYTYLAKVLDSIRNAKKGPEPPKREVIPPDRLSNDMPYHRYFVPDEDDDDE